MPLPFAKSLDAITRRLEAAYQLTPADFTCLGWLCASVAHYRAGQHLVQEGEKTDNVFIILSGWAQRYKTLANGQRQVFSYLIPGDLSDVHAPPLGLADHGICALNDADIAIVPRNKMVAALQSAPMLSKAFIWSMVVDKSILREWIINITRREAYERTAHLFCEMHARMDVVGMVTNDSFSMPATQEQLGHSTAMSSVHVNRVLKRMRTDRLIETGQKRLRILDIDRLKKIAEFDTRYLKFATAA